MNLALYHALYYVSNHPLNLELSRVQKKELLLFIKSTSDNLRRMWCWPIPIEISKETRSEIQEYLKKPLVEALNNQPIFSLEKLEVLKQVYLK